MNEIILSVTGDNLIINSTGGNGDTVTIDASNDFGGQKKYHSPTELFCSSIGSCILIMMQKKAIDNNINLKNSIVRISYKYIIKNDKTKIKEINLNFIFVEKISEDKIKLLKNEIENCPIHSAISKDVNLNINFQYIKN